MERKNVFLIEQNNKIYEYLVLYNENEVSLYTRSLQYKDKEKTFIRRLLEAEFIDTYADIRGVLSPNKIKYLTNYIYNTNGNELHRYSKKGLFQIVDYDSFFDTNTKIEIIAGYIKLLKFDLINCYEKSIIEQAYINFSSSQMQKTAEVKRGIKTFLDYASSSKVLFETLGLEFCIENNLFVKRK